MTRKDLLNSASELLARGYSKPTDPHAKTDYENELDRIAMEIRTNQPHLSSAESQVAALQHPDGQRLYDASCIARHEKPIRKSAPPIDSSFAPIAFAAEEIRKRTPSLSDEQALTKALEDDPALYDRYLLLNPEMTGRKE